MASSDSWLNYVPAPQPALSQSACLALSLTKSNKVFGGTGILKWIHLYRFPGGQHHLLEDKTQSTVHYQPWRQNWIINLWEQLKLWKQLCFLGGRDTFPVRPRAKSVKPLCFIFCRYSFSRLSTLRHKSTKFTWLFYSTPCSIHLNKHLHSPLISHMTKATVLSLQNNSLLSQELMFGYLPANWVS